MLEVTSTKALWEISKCLFKCFNPCYLKNWEWKYDIYNNQRFIITKINKEKELITLKYKDNNETFDIEFNKFQRFFYQLIVFLEKKPPPMIAQRQPCIWGQHSATEFWQAAASCCLSLSGWNREDQQEVQG